MVVLTLGALGGIVGLIIAAIAASYGADRRLCPFCPWPRRRIRGYSTSSRAARVCARFVVHPRPAARGHVPTLRLLWAQGVTAMIFSGLGARYGAEPALLLVSVVEATLLLLLLVIDLDQRLVPTPAVVLLVAVALASATLWPGVGLRDALIGGAVGCGSFAALVGLARLLWGPDALGLGDAYLALAIGCITGYPRVVATLALGIVLGGIAAGSLLLIRRVGLRQTLPYGPFLITVTIGMLVSGRTIYL